MYPGYDTLSEESLIISNLTIEDFVPERGFTLKFEFKHPLRISSN